MFELSPFRDTPYNLQFIFAGKMFNWQYRQSFSPGTTNFHIKTGASQIVHFTERALQTGSTSINVQLIENPTLTDGTVQVTAYNVNRASATTHSMAIFNNPAVIVGGSTIESITLVANDKWDQRSDEFILKNSEDYILRIINSGAGNAVVDINYVWYESSN